MKNYNVHLAFSDYFDKGLLNPYLYFLSKKMTEGNVCLDLSEAPMADDVKSLEYEPALLAGQQLVGTAGEVHPFILDDNKLYLQRYYQYETRFLDDIARLIAREDIDTAMENVHSEQAFIRSLFPASSAITDWQLVAVLSAMMHHFQIITGGPGTGKTTSVAKLLTVLFTQNPAIRVLLCAPTGKAAVRMAESLSRVSDMFQNEKISVDESVIECICQLKPTTIHSMLGYIPDSIYFKHNRDFPLAADVIIVDECSMIDIALFSKLLSAVDNDTRLILLGDKNQLSSVEAGSLFGDLCSALPQLNIFSDKYKELFSLFTQVDTAADPQVTAHIPAQHITELQISHRFSNDGGIGRLSKAIIQNDQEKIFPYFNNEDDEVTIHEKFDEEEIKQFSLKFGSWIREKDVKFALQKINNARILCAVRQGQQGVYRINQIVERYLTEQGLLNAAGEFYENQLVMVTRNQPEIGLYNGDTGIIRIENGIARACFMNVSGELVKVAPGMIQQAETAFAITIHKSQGSEFSDILIVLPVTDESPVLSRELLYTALTRAKRHAEMISSRDMMIRIVEKSVKRISGIVNRLKSMEI